MEQRSSATGNKRLVLIVEDNELNREMLSAILEDEYALLTAENGAVGLQLLSEHYRELSLVLLDVYMPVCTGFEFLERIREDALLSSVPVIVTTGSNKPEDEARCLKLGASDFVTKPYNPEVVLGRARSIIRLRESVATLSVVEYDSLTGVYTMQAFYHHAAQLLAGPEDYDLSVTNLQEFKLINGMYGVKKGDEVLTYLASSFSAAMPGAIFARNGDKFFALYPSRCTLDPELGQMQFANIIQEAPIPNLQIKLGLYHRVDKSRPISILCDRVLMAISAIRNDCTRVVAEYDDALAAQLLENQRMEARFDEALRTGEFVVWYQPKVSVTTEQIVGAEALVRWQPAGARMISPGRFIPLFEGDGLICRLDEYVFREVCELQRTRLEQGLAVVPISVNLSRNSVYQIGTVERYLAIAREKGVPLSLVPIELTESAAIEGAGITTMAEQLVRSGFLLHMDDFGTGYSSMSSLTQLPFEVIKLDKSLIDRIGTYKGDTVLRYMIGIAHEMGMRIVAEGVEDRGQVDFLGSIGCDMIQGYFFSPPRDPDRLRSMLDEIRQGLPLDLAEEYRRLSLNARSELELDDRSLAMLEKVADGMEEGFFIYRASSEETLIYANPAVMRLYGCESIEELRRHVSNSFRGFVHPEEYARVEESIFRQINSSDSDQDFVQYHIVRRDGTVLKVKDRGYCVHTQLYGNVFYVFIHEDIG